MSEHRSPRPQPEELGQLMGELVQAGNRVTAMWLEAMRRVGRSLEPPTPGVAADPEPQADSLQLVVRLAANRPTEVWANLGSAPRGRSLVLDALQPVQPEHGALRGVEIERRENDVGRPVVLSIEVPDDQAVGTYMGLVHDAETREPVGLVRVRVES